MTAPTQKRLAGRTAFVTGAGRGIGEAVASALAREGAQVGVSGRSLETVETVVSSIRAAGGCALALACDVSDRPAVEAAVATTAEVFGPVDILVNNAQGGRVHGGVRLEDVSPDEVRTSFEGGPLATLHGMQACFPGMRQRGGTIVNLGSSVGVAGDPGFADYGMAKEAIRALTKHAAREWGRYGITANVLCPLALSAGTIRYRNENPDVYERTVLRTIPLGRVGDPDDDIAPVVIALATDLRYLTGATLMVDGGRCILR